MADHKCVGCVRMIPDHIERCLFCKNALRKRGLCEMCGKKPPESNATHFCTECKVIAKREAAALKADRGPYYQAKFRGAGSRENTYQTKHGTGY